MRNSDSDARRTASGPLPSQPVRARHGAPPVPPDPAHRPALRPAAPLRLCAFATIALLGWLTGPVALAVFAAIGFIGYGKARRQGLKQSNCYLRDTRIVLGYLSRLLGAGAWGIFAMVAHLARQARSVKAVTECSARGEVHFEALLEHEQNRGGVRR